MSRLKKMARLLDSGNKSLCSLWAEADVRSWAERSAVEDLLRKELRPCSGPHRAFAQMV